jgi:hypothetical protein
VVDVELYDHAMEAAFWWKVVPPHLFRELFLNRRVLSLPFLALGDFASVPRPSS